MLIKMSKLNFSTKWIYFLAILPAVALFYRAFSGGLGVDPVKKLEHELGLLTIQFLVLTLLISPLRDLFKINLIKYRRSLGVMTFFYAFSHFLVSPWAFVHLLLDFFHNPVFICHLWLCGLLGGDGTQDLRGC